jgi:hypothetical protein
MVKKQQIAQCTRLGSSLILRAVYSAEAGKIEQKSSWGVTGEKGSESPETEMAAAGEAAIAAFQERRIGKRELSVREADELSPARRRLLTEDGDTCLSRWASFVVIFFLYEEVGFFC